MVPVSNDQDTLADRAWLAYHSLSRNSRGKPPSQKSLEEAHDLSRATLSKTFSGERTQHRADTLHAMAEALGVSADWLLKGEGEAPVATGPVPPRPGTFQPNQWVEPARRYHAIDEYLEQRAAAGKPVAPEVQAEVWKAAAHTGVGRTLDLADAEALVTAHEAEHRARRKGRTTMEPVELEDDSPPFERRRRAKRKR